MKDKGARKKIYTVVQNPALICAFLAIAILFAYFKVSGYGFINLDDHLYVVQNSHVQSGISLENIKWSLTSTRASNWHPLTWISLMLDYQVFGLKPGAYHMMNVLFHVANALLLFLALRRMTGALWQSAFVAALFALHPLHVESVAWISERKDVLCTFFGMLTLWAYAGYVENRKMKSYFLVLLLFTLGLMSKPMLVTLPFVLLLMDYWPLGRIRLEETGFKKHLSSTIPLILEKLPLLILAAASSVMTIIAQKAGGAIASTEIIPMRTRTANALVSYVTYLWKAIWPLGLTIFYPYLKTIPLWQVLGAGLLIVLITLVVIMNIRERPYLAVGWFWYLGTLVPVIGIVQVGSQAMADRYTYIPLIGIFIMVAWGIPELISRMHRARATLAMSSIAIVLILMVITRIQTGYWKDNMTLCRHALDVTRNNYMAHNSLALTLDEKGKTGEAVKHYVEALKIKPDYVDAHVNLGLDLLDQGKISEAIKHFKEALRINPDCLEAEVNLGAALSRLGRFEEAIKHYLKAERMTPYSADIQNNLGVALAREGNLDEAITHFKKALEIRPNNKEAQKNLKKVMAARTRLDKAIEKTIKLLGKEPGNITLHNRLGDLYRARGKQGQAIEQYQKALSIRPDSLQTLNKLAIVYADKNEYDKALVYLKKIVELRPGSPGAYYNMACIYARQNKIDNAIKWLREAVAKGFHNWDLIKKDPDLENIRGTEHYKELVQRYK